MVDAKVSAKAITEQTEGSVSDVTGADEVLIYDAETGALLRVTVDEFISGSGIGTLVTEFDNLVVTGFATVGIFTAQWVSGNLQGVLYNSTGNPVLDPDGPGFGGTVFGNVVSNVNTGFSTFNNIMVSGMHTAGIITCDYIFGGFSGKIYNNQGNPIFNSEDASFGGTLYGDVVAGSSGFSTFKDVSVTGVITAADATFRNIKTSGITTIQDHLEVNDSTGSGTEYNLNVKTSGSSTFGVLGNGAVLLGNNSGAPFMATNDHHATSKKYVDDAISASIGIGTVNPNGGLEGTASGLSIKVRPGYGISVSSQGLQIGDDWSNVPTLP